MPAYEYSVDVLAEDGADTPPTLVDFEVLSVEPAKAAGSGVVAVTVRIPF